MYYLNLRNVTITSHKIYNHYQHKINKYICKKQIYFVTYYGLIFFNQFRFSFRQSQPAKNRHQSAPVMV